MQHNGLSWAIAMVALLVLLPGARLLLSRGWLLGWIRGSSGLALLVLAAVAGLAAWDLRSYAPLPASAEALVTLRIESRGGHSYLVSLEEGQRRRELTVDGELWQLDARVLGWKGLATLIGLRPGYRLDLLATRYRDPGLQGGGESNRIPLAQSPYDIDLWRWLRAGGWDLFLLDIRGERLTFLPLVDGAGYRVRLTGAGLLAEPLNQVARKALARSS